MRQRFDAGSGLAGAGALVLLVSLFLHWYAPDLRAWDAFEWLDWALGALAIATLVGVVHGEQDATAAARWLPWVGLAALLVVVSQLIDPPPAAREHSREIGAWLAFVAAAAMLAGGALATANVSVTVDVRGRERRRRVAAVDRRGAGTGEAADARANAGTGTGSAEETAAGLAERARPGSGAGPGGRIARPAGTRDDDATAVTPTPGDPDRTQPIGAIEPRGERGDRGDTGTSEA